jgi:hypothetical protein
MTPPRIGDCVSVERHESQDGHRVHVYVHSFICCYFFLTTLYHERIVRTLLAHSLWSFDRFYLLRWTHFFSIYLFICLWRECTRPSLMSHWNLADLYLFLMYPEPKFSLLYFYFLILFSVFGREVGISLRTGEPCSILSSRFPNGLIWARATHLL